MNTTAPTCALFPTCASPESRENHRTGSTTIYHSESTGRVLGRLATVWSSRARTRDRLRGANQRPSSSDLVVLEPHRARSGARRGWPDRRRHRRSSLSSTRAWRGPGIRLRRSSTRGLQVETRARRSFHTLASRCVHAVGVQQSERSGDCMPSLVGDGSWRISLHSVSTNFGFNELRPQGTSHFLAQSLFRCLRSPGVARCRP